MPRRRWVQFSLRFLFAATFLAAAVAWWFRPGVVKPEFSLERFSHEIDPSSGKKMFNAHIRLTNSGWDSIWMQNKYDCSYEIDMGEEGIIDQYGRQIVFSGGLQGAFHELPLRLTPREQNFYTIQFEEGSQTIKIGVDIADRRKQRERTYWSQTFEIPDDVFSSPNP